MSKKEPLSEHLTEQAIERQAEDTVHLELGGRLRFTKDDFEWSENRQGGETASPAEPLVHETDSPTEYLTVHYQNGNYEWFEFNFRVDDGTAYLGSKVRLSQPRNGRGWIPPEVREAIQDYHPELDVVSDPPPWWE